MLTKSQKLQQIEESKDMLKQSRILAFVDFSGTTVEDIKKLRRLLSSVGAKLKVFKKKLLRIALKDSGFDFDPEQFDLQVGTVSSQGDISEIAGLIYKFSKEIKNKKFKILGAYDLAEKNLFDAAMVTRIGQLPPREVLLGQLVGMLVAPMRMFLYVLNEKSKMVEK
ncbi:50S ribosomal protein L10 [Candidatus Wolfebacteria bacterium CG_4_9_14_3_um_filter_37_9]|uniref:Large ribosomal subunit protein uL10 n=1 Tax=Candidatus Wolfebacteria bacterium CG_4_9_14_3_um_filter_37_9 TaxID=1975065 RepID=A0A2M7X6P9_9BACT|nr:MAG: 50S ribosomal protein L10 [Candidatus Wolfebacteria bacterium CG_4_9_14_3_um_filter_37_9]